MSSLQWQRAPYFSPPPLHQCHLQLCTEVFPLMQAQSRRAPKLWLQVCVPIIWHLLVTPTRQSGSLQEMACLDKVDLNVMRIILTATLHTPVFVVTCRSVGLSVFVVWNVLGELCTQRQFLPLLFAVVRHPWYLLRLLWTVYCLQLR